MAVLSSCRVDCVLAERSIRVEPDWKHSERRVFFEFLHEAALRQRFPFALKGAHFGAVLRASENGVSDPRIDDRLIGSAVEPCVVGIAKAPRRKKRSPAGRG